MNGNRCAQILMVLMVASVTSEGLAQTSRPSVSEPPPTTRVVIEPWPYPNQHAHEQFRRGSWEYSLGGTAITIDSHDHDALGFASLGAGYFLADGLSANLELDLSPGKCEGFVYDDESGFDGSFHLRALGGMGLLRGQVLRSSTVSVYIEGGIGGLHARAFPSHTATDKWVEAVGGGLTYRFSENGRFSVGARYVRLSDNFLGGSGRRASNGIQLYAGFTLVP